MSETRQGSLFDGSADRLRLPRRPRRFLMHVCDSGCNGPDPGFNAQFECDRCGHVSEWMGTTLTAARRGIPCPLCNEAAA